MNEKLNRRNFLKAVGLGATALTMLRYLFAMRPENKEIVKKLSPAELPEFGDSTNNAGVYSFNQAIGFRLQR